MKGTAAGTEHIDPPSEWIASRDIDALLKRAEHKEFIGPPLDDWAQPAGVVLDYLAARVVVTARSACAILGAVLNGARRCLILGSPSADLSQMTTLQAVLDERVAHEYRVPDVPLH
jgi:hypothetical protein